MKKVILALAIVSVTFAACNDGGTKVETPAVDTTAAPAAVDTTAPAAPVAVDSAK